jgi:hypothetical protein
MDEELRMRIAELLTAIASWLESPQNEALLLAEYDEDCLKVVAESCVEAAHALKKAAEQVDAIEPPEESKVTPESVESIAALAAALDSSEDPELRKQASVLDELLLSIAAPPAAAANIKSLQDNRLEALKQKYEQPRKDLHEADLIGRSEKAIEKSEMVNRIPINEMPLSSRYCPDHAGVQITRVGEHMWQCEMDKKVYNFETGYKLNDGTQVPGGDVALQTANTMNVPYHAIFDTREGRLGYNK